MSSRRFSRVLRRSPSRSVERVGCLRVEPLERRDAPAQMMLPDMHVRAEKLSGWSYKTITGGREIRFDTGMANGGKGPFELNATTTTITDPDGTQRQLVNQKIYWDDGTTTTQPAGYFVYHPTHGHTHFDDFARASIRTRPTANWQDGSIVAIGPKTSYCLIDGWHYNSALPGSPASSVYSLNACLNGPVQGISVGWADVYSQSLDGQSINITGLPNGNYWLEVSADVADAILETNETNNTTRLAITISGQPTVGFRVQSGTPTGTNNTPVSFVDLRFNQPVNSATFTPADVVLTTPNGTVAVTSITTVDASNYRINFPTQGSIGTYTVTVGPDISNLSGQKLDQNNNGVGGEAADFFYNIFTVVAPRLLSVSPAGTVAPPVNTIRVTYTKPMASATFTTADLVSFTGPGGTSLLGEVTGIVPFVAGPSSAIFDVTLKAPLTDFGLYNLVIEPSVLDEFGNPVDQNNDNKSDAADRFTAVWTVQEPGTAGPDPFGYRGVNVPLQSLSLVAGGPNTSSVSFSDVDDGFVAVPLGTNSINFYGVNYTGSNQLHFNANGLITFGSGSTAWQNDDLQSLSVPAIAPLWDDWDHGGGSPQAMYRFDDLTGDGQADRLVIQWNQISHHGNPTNTNNVTFQAALQLNSGATPGTVLFNYPDLLTGDAYANGVSATVGIRSGAAGASRLVVSFNGSSSMLGNGKAMLLAVPTVSSITRLDTNPADAGEVEFAVTFSDPVTGVDVTDFALSTTGVVGAYVDHIHTTADPAVVVVHARTGVGAGTVRLDLVDDDTIITGQGTKLGGLGTANGSFSTGEVYTVVQPPPVVQSAVVGDGTAQRSMVRELRVTFDYPVVTAGIPADAFMLVGPGGSVAVSVDTASLSTPFQTIAKLTFAGPGGSLTDGDYTLTVLGIKISTGGVALDGDGNGSPGGDYVLTFHRLFGDADGDRDVDAGDFGAFRTAFGTSSAVFDSDADGDVDAADFGAFRSAFGTSLP